MNKYFKKLVCFITILAMVFTLAACAGDGGSAENTGDTVTVTDHAGYEVTLPVNPERIVVCDIVPLPSVLSVFFDSAEKIVGMTPTSMSAAENGLLSELYPEILNAETSFINGTDVNVEELLLLDPDVVFYSAGTAALGDLLRESGFNAVGISVNKWDYDCIETLENWISLISQIFPDNDKTDAVAEYSNKVYDLVQSRVKDIPEDEKEEIFFLFKYGETDLMTSGTNFFGQWWAESIGAINVAEELTQENQVSINMEQVYAWDPEMIFISNFTSAMPEDLYNNTVGNYNWSGIEAVEEKEVYKMPLGMYRSYTPGADTPITLLWMAKTVYPELFTDIDIIEYTIDYYETVFGVTLTEEQAASIFSPAREAAAGF
ncbi:MAG: ABC transporter substrate-binding protein [Firmicutes bacterium]|nr:ABC transporter substrate-binding protein [Bacillota bacterium]